MKGERAIFPILLLFSGGVMMAPMARLPALNEKLHARQEAPPRPRREQGQVVTSQQNLGGQTASRAPEAVRP